MEWFEKLGFDNNPFETNLFRISKETVGLEKEKKEILYRVAAGSMILIEGPSGTGKTGLLKHIIDNFKGKGKVIYVDGDKLNKALDIESLLINRYGWKGRLFNKKPRDMILLLDNINSISRKNAEKIKFYFDQDYLRSVVFTSKDYSKVDVDASITDRIDKRVISLSNPDKKELIDMLNERLDDNLEFTEDIIKNIVDLSEQNPKAVLANAEKIGKYLSKKEKKDLTKEQMKKIIQEKSEKKKEEDKEIFKCASCGEKLKKMGNYWRCKNCDYYCSGCGALIEDDDKECPECGNEFEE